jgi:SAM-dependent methyltransferase
LNKSNQDKIEILSVELLDMQRELVAQIREFAKSLKLEFGWHYLLDITWIITQLGKISGKRLVDAGAGIGIMQWYLASQGAEVTSIDRLTRADLPLRFRSKFRIEGLRPEDLNPPLSTLNPSLSIPTPGGTGLELSVKITRLFKSLVELTVYYFNIYNQGKNKKFSKSKVIIYNQDLDNLVDIKSNSMDAVVAVSALEHNSLENLEHVLAEIMRVLKPGAPLIATLVTAGSEDRWHEPSNGWCLSESSLKRIFQINRTIESNFSRYDELFSMLGNCAELRDKLAGFYFKSGDNGMPWGEWSPQYQPVGIYKVKPK